MPTLDYTTARAHVARIQQSLDAKVADIRVNKSLTEAGKRREIAAVTLEARKQADAAKAQFATERAQRRESLNRAAFGNPANHLTEADRLSMRDAHDRASRLDSEDAAKAMLNRAVLDGDESLAKAIGARAYERGWGAVVNEYGTRYDRLSFIDELDETPTGPMTSTADAIVFRLRPPSEIQGYASDSDLERLVSSEVTA
ncbi:hypothetical protein [Mycobacterium marseillense]|uniref:hypothetical protein n=1 Tax=Mycobacterium marseillense TaxID=701042 RepID=UPI00119E77AC|nr:hypothetical protein [Mycobacterium marseillense]